MLKTLNINGGIFELCWVLPHRNVELRSVQHVAWVIRRTAEYQALFLELASWISRFPRLKASFPFSVTCLAILAWVLGHSLRRKLSVYELVSF